MKGKISVFEIQILSLRLLEKELYRLYSTISKKVDDVAAKTLFSYIATDSLKHSKILDMINDEFNSSKSREQDIDQNLLYTKKLIRSHTNDLKKGKTSREEIKTLIDELLGFENLLLDEYKRAFHLHYTSFGGLGQEKNLTEINIFTLIVSDEVRHQEILAAITNLLENRLTFNEHAPVVKYQRPDAWYSPPR